MAATSSAVSSPTVLQLLASDLRWSLVAALARSDRQVHELVRMVGQPANLVSYHLRRLRSASLVTERRSSADARDVYYSLDLDRLRELYLGAGRALHPALAGTESHDRLRLPTDPSVRVLFLCTHNSARSQMAEAIMDDRARGTVEVFSAGSEPTMVHPDAIATLEDLGIAIPSARAKHLDEYRGKRFDYVITVCDRVREVCPAFPEDPERIHWSLPDPSTIRDPVDRRREFELIAHQLELRIRNLLGLIQGSRQECA